MNKSQTNAEGINYTIIFTLTLIHFAGDFYSAFFTPLLPVFVDKFGLSLAQVGLITGMVRLLSFIVQPVTGYFSDRYESRWFVLTGLFLVITAIPFTGAAQSVWLLFTLLCAGSFGSSMFHPSVAGMVPLYAGNRAGFSMSIFNTGGAFAFAVGPVFITWYVMKFGLEKMPFTMIIGLIVFLVSLKFMPKPVSDNLSRAGFVTSMKNTFGKVYKLIAFIWITMVLRAVVGQAFQTFMPIYLADKGFHLMGVGAIISLFILAGTISGLLAGYLGDRMGFKKVFFISHAVMTPALILFLYLPDQFVYLGAFLAGFAVMASLPLGVAMAQKLVPKSRAMVSSLMMGFAYGLGGLVSPLIGRIADSYGIENTLLGCAFIPVFTLFLIMKFPRTV